MIQAVVLDAMGVIYTAGDDVADLLIPFARDHGCTLSEADIAERYRQCSLGVCSSAVLWQQLGLSGVGVALDAAYLRAHTLTPGLVPFLQLMHDRHIPVACLSNDVAEWSRGLRALHGLDDLITTWIISGEVGARKPDPAIYHHCLRALGRAASDCLFVDDRPANLDAAGALGFHTSLFAPLGPPPEAQAHPLSSDFAQLAVLMLQEDDVLSTTWEAP